MSGSRATGGDVFGSLKEFREQEGGDFVGFVLSEVVAVGYGEEGFADFGVSCEECAQLGELARVAAVFECIHVPRRRACAGASSTAWHATTSPTPSVRGRRARS